MGLDFYIYKTNKVCNDTKELRRYTALQGKEFRSGYKHHNPKAMLRGFYTQEYIDSTPKSVLRKNLNSILNYIKHRKIDVSKVDVEKVAYFRKWFPLKWQCEEYYDEEKEGCPFNLYGRLILTKEILEDIVKQLKDENSDYWGDVSEIKKTEEYQHKIYELLKTTDFSKETLYAEYWQYD